MQQVSQPITKDLVLIGGGHSHAIVLRMFGIKPLPGLRITLITATSDTPYSGMLPGHVAGFYSHNQCHINMRSLAQFAQAQLYIDQVIGLDLENKKVLCTHRFPVAFDLLSIDIGSTPATINIPGAAEYAIPAKPVSQLLTHWNQLIDSVTQTPQKPINLGIVGGGAGGVELALAMQSRLHQILKAAQQSVKNLEINLFNRGAELMPHYNSRVRRRFQEILTQRGIYLHLQETVCAVQPHKINCESGLKVECDSIFWVTQASAPWWLKVAGLATDAKGFIQVNDTLQSVSHPDVFAAGDVATMVNHPRPKAGVFAVRQGKPLFRNLRLAAKSSGWDVQTAHPATLVEHLLPYKPQKKYLSLIGLGDGRAIASWGSLSFGPSHLLWRWKDLIDRQFMEQFSNLPKMSRGAG